MVGSDDPVRVSLITQEDHDFEYESVKNLLLDPSRLHGLCISAFRVNNLLSSGITSPKHLKAALSHIFHVCGMEPLSDEDVADLWTGGLNFSEFYLISREILSSFHQTTNADNGIAL